MTTTTMETAALAVRGVSAKYGGASGALTSVDLTVPRGQIVSHQLLRLRRNS